jgi:hypothetical protein
VGGIYYFILTVTFGELKNASRRVGANVCGDFSNIVNKVAIEQTLKVSG